MSQRPRSTSPSPPADTDPKASLAGRRFRCQRCWAAGTFVRLTQGGWPPWCVRWVTEPIPPATEPVVSYEAQAAPMANSRCPACRSAPNELGLGVRKEVVLWPRNSSTGRPGHRAAAAARAGAGAAGAEPGRAERPKLSPLVRRARALLARMGFEAEVRIPSNPRFPFLEFRHAAALHFVQLDEEDADFLQVSRVHDLHPDLRPDEMTALRAAHAAQASLKVVKVFIGRETSFVEFQAPVFLAGGRPNAGLLGRCLEVLGRAAIEFRNQLGYEGKEARA